MSKKKSKPILRTFSVPEIDLEALRRQMGHSASLHTAWYVARPISPDKPVDDEKESTIH
jgi:hypothetical protein